MGEASAKARGIPYVAAAGLALGLWAWAIVRLLQAGCAGEDAVAPVAPLLVDLNSADEAALRTLPGIGGTYARRIVAEREANGAFRNPDDLLRVRGVTRELIEGIGHSVVCGEVGGAGVADGLKEPGTQGEAEAHP